jgi:hypothetical protein
MGLRSNRHATSRTTRRATAGTGHASRPGHMIVISDDYRYCFAPSMCVRRPGQRAFAAERGWHRPCIGMGVVRPVHPRSCHDHPPQDRSCQSFLRGAHSARRAHRLRAVPARHQGQGRDHLGCRPDGHQALCLEGRQDRQVRRLRSRNADRDHQAPGHSEVGVRRHRVDDDDPRPEGTALGHHHVGHERHAGAGARRRHRILQSVPDDV